ncbi:DUF554 family protein [Brevibacillus daliensis]
MSEISNRKIVGIGLNLVGLTNMRVANFLPGILVTAILVSCMYFIQ